MSFSFDILTGRSEERILTSSFLACPAHGEIIDDILKLSKEASKEGFTLAVASGFRSFERQLKIFNTKAERGLDLFAILRYSALPGASRHHWGTEIDFFDSAAVNSDYKLQLVAEEYEPQAPFGPMTLWLNERMKEKDFPFFRPYAADLGGVASEPWHLSHRLSKEYFSNYKFEIFEENIQKTDLAYKDLIWERREELFERFFTRISPP